MLGVGDAGRRLAVSGVLKSISAGAGPGTAGTAAKGVNGSGVAGAGTSLGGPAGTSLGGPAGTMECPTGTGPNGPGAWCTTG